MNKKVISSVLAGVMALSIMGTSVFAADKAIKTAGATTYKVAATLAAPEINVTIPGSVSAVVNPYGVSFEMKGTLYGATGLASGTYTIKNNTSASAVMVSVTPTIVVPTKLSDPKDKTSAKVQTIKVLTAEADDYSSLTEKSIFATVVGLPASGTLPATTEDADIPALKLLDDGKNKADKNVVTVPFIDATLMDSDTVKAQKAKGLMVIPKGVKAAAAVKDDDGNEVTPAVEAAFGYGQFTIGGDITPNSVELWTSADKLSLNLILDIGPCADDADVG